MAARRPRKTSTRRGASHGRKRSAPSYYWFFAGLLIGLGLSLYLFVSGYLPERLKQQPTANNEQIAADDPREEDSISIADDSDIQQYKFFTLLPEMEVIVPDQSLANEQQPAANSENNTYYLQAGSFQNEPDAEQMKARLALLGNVADVQTVTVNNTTWHRVRIGPIEGARRMDEVRRTLQDNNIPTLVVRGSP